MFINEYGNRNDPTIILFAPMMISGADLYGQMRPFFQGSYHIIAPDTSTAAIWQRIRKNTWKKSSDLSGGLYE